MEREEDYILAAGFIQFVLYEEQHMAEGMHSYERFMEELQRSCPFGVGHIPVPLLRKKELEVLPEDWFQP